MCEFITAGGLSEHGDTALPASLLHEGTVMRDALLRDLSELKQYTLISMHGDELLPSAYAEKSLPVSAGEFKKAFKKSLKYADLVWLIAPETDGILLELTELCLAEEEKRDAPFFVGCGYDATLIGTSKSLSFEALQVANIYTLPVYAGEDLIQPAYFEAVLNLKETLIKSKLPPPQAGEGWGEGEKSSTCPSPQPSPTRGEGVNQRLPKWVAKPEDGVGCDGIQLFDSLNDLKDWLEIDNRYLHYFAQPYQEGVSASISFICYHGTASLLSCNQQHIVCDGSTFKLTGITVNGMAAYWLRFETLARKIAKMLPDARGYMGVDVIIEKESDKIYVIDINPRLTSSYSGLKEAIGRNPAQLILGSQFDPHFKMPCVEKNVVEVVL